MAIYKSYIPSPGAISSCHDDDLPGAGQRLEARASAGGGCGTASSAGRNAGRKPWEISNYGRFYGKTYGKYLVYMVNRYGNNENFKLVPQLSNIYMVKTLWKYQKCGKLYGKIWRNLWEHLVYIL